MNPKLIEKLKESLAAVVPITLIVMGISVLLVPLELGTVVMFFVGALMLIVGMGFFQLGAEISMTPMGKGIGSEMAGSRRLPVILGVGFLMGAIITMAEPDLQVLANQVPFQYQFHGQGTVSGELLETLGLGSIEKSILMVYLPRCMAAQLLKKLRRELRLGDANTGVAFTVPMTGGSGRFIRLLEALEPEHRAQDRERSEAAMTESGYTTVLTIVDRGFSEDVMHAARSAGATGGTVFNTRRLVNEETMKFWGMAVQQEREIVAILTDAEHKMAIMKAISDHCGIRTEARGVVLSLPVDQVIGLE